MNGQELKAKIDNLLREYNVDPDTMHVDIDTEHFGDPTRESYPEDRIRLVIQPAALVYVLEFEEDGKLVNAHIHGSDKALTLEEFDRREAEARKMHELMHQAASATTKN